jgi:hypothetical protein
MAVDQFQATVRQFIGEQAAGETHFAVQDRQRGALELGVRAKVELMRPEIAGANAAVGLGAEKGGGAWRSLSSLPALETCSSPLAMRR